MPDAPKQLKVFLCHSSHDKAVVREVYRKLNSEGWIDPWLDSEKLLPGQDWNLEIEKAVETSHIVLVFLSNNSVNKEGYIQKELRLVLDVALNMPEETIFVIPVKLEECQIPRRLQSWQWLTYFPPEERTNAYERLLKSLKIRADKLGIKINSPKTAEPVLEPRKTPAPLTVAPPPDPDLDLYIPPEYSGATFTPPPAKVKTWTFGGLEFVKVPHGEFLMGSKAGNKQAFDDEKPQHKLTIPYDFLMARFPVTNEQFAAFVKVASYSTLAEKEGFGWVWNRKEWIKTKGANWKHPHGPQTNIDGISKHPVVQLAWVDGLAYFDWLMNQFGRDVPGGLFFRAPTEAEWEKAARGTDGREYPWGDEFNPANCNSGKGGPAGTTPVGAFSPQGDSPYGVCDLSGNVWEWTASLWGKDVNTPNYKYPYNSRDGRENSKAGDDVLHVLRGGSFVNETRLVRAAFRNWYLPNDWNGNLGFRVVLAPRLG